MENDTAKSVESLSTIQVLDKGKIQLIQFIGGDRMIAAAARVSNGIFEDVTEKSTEKDAKLINYLMRHRHGSPFEHSVFTFYIKTPLFVAREWHRHRISSFNEISGRYTEFEPEFYIPDRFRVPAASNKQGSNFLNNSIADTVLSTEIEKWNRKAYEEYKYLLGLGLAKEVARIVLPLNLYTQFYYTVNARSLMNFLSLRAAPDAQWEIQQYAIALQKIFKEKMPATYNAWILNEKIVP
jgi:thymidylate synthase (FAD)